MVSNAVFEDEKEYLLPRNIIFELISKQGKEYTILAKPFKKDQFAIKTGCFPIDFYDIKPTTLSSIISKKLSSSPTKVKSKADSAKIKDNVKPVKSKRCPNGMVRNKITKECVPKQNMKTKAKPEPEPEPEPKPEPKPPKTKMARCPKGTRRNPKTLLCVPKL